ncbi:MAG TPA: HEAT repeat domain-containing protein [Steroidobacteraceae bacterium]|nr:HEAT repeat domain-containing protein [Steroidobacteraceae bacterium]
MNAKRVGAAVAACVALGLAAQGRSAEIALPKDGWASWQVEAVEDAPAWCCFNWNDHDATPETCRLGDDNRGFGTRDHATTDSVRVYARFKAGKLEKLRALAAACPVDTKTPVQKLENVAADDSVRWLTGIAKQKSTQKFDLDDDALAALAIHRGATAFDALNGFARADADAEARKKAIFWMAVLRGAAGAKVTTDLMFGDADSEVRKHAAFAVTQSKSATKTADLTRLGDTDKDGDVRAQAWFWLAHTGAEGAERAIANALRKDADDHVREQAVFALSQLPDDRATPALIHVAEDQSLSREQRKRALFWLGQSKSPTAVAYLDRVLTSAAAR